MKKLVFACCALQLALTAFAAEPNKKPMTEAEKAARRQIMLQKTGGIVEKAAEGNVVVVNAQKKASDALIAELLKKFTDQTHYNIKAVPGTCEMYKLPAGADAAVVLVDDPALPPSIIVPERQWGLLNVAKLGDKNFDLRVTKMFLRVTTLAFGGAISQFKGSALNPVRESDIDMLDKYVCDNYTFDNMTAIVRNLGALGFAQARRSSYRRACQEGWAAAPTNDYQKVIWEEIHAKPTNPMTIKYDAKKGE